MATNNNTIKTRIQLKSDTEENWRKSVLTTDAPGIGLKTSGASFVPLKGELIVYLEDSTHPFSRLKIGDGNTNVVNLPFVNAVTINGDEIGIVKKNSANDFPSPGSSDKLYIDLSTNRIYHYVLGSGYAQLFNVSTTTIGSVMDWTRGEATIASAEGNVLKIDNGSAPNLFWMEKTVVNDVM